MSINSYIDSLTKIDQNKNGTNITWSKVVQDKKPQHAIVRPRGVRPYQCELEPSNQGYTCQKDQNYHRERKASKGYNGKANYGQQQFKNSQRHDNNENYGEHRFAGITPSVREVGSGYHTFSNNAIEKRYRAKQAEYSSTESSDTSTAYATANSKSTEESFQTATDNFRSLKLTDSSKDEEFVMDPNEERFKRNALMTGLIHTQDDFSIISTSGNSSDCYNASQDTEEENWDKEESDESMRKGRLIRFFESTEDKDVLVHPLREQVQKDPKWQQWQISRKATEFIQTPRNYYLNLKDETFGFEAPKKSAE